MEVHRKTAQGVDGAARIRRQADLLSAAARHPGVVELVGLEGSVERPVLVTVVVDGPTLAAPMPLTVEEVAGVVGAVAATLADLHQLGIVHGAVAPEHVLLAPDGRPVLCGFGSAGRVGDELHPAADVAALGRLLRRLASGPEARPLRRIADAATAEDPVARPTAAEVASEIAAAVPGGRLPVPRPDALPYGPDRGPDLRSLVAGAQAGRRGRGRVIPPHGAGEVAAATPAPAGGPRPPLGRRRVSARWGAVAGAIVTVPAAAILVLAPWSSPAADHARSPAVSHPPPSTRRSPSTTGATAAATPTSSSSTVLSSRSDCPTPAAVLIADVDGDGCLDALNYADGVLEGAGVRWAVGRVGDQIATGDWSCRGSRTLVLLRPSTGEVFRFDGWAVGAQASVTGAMVATVPGGQAVRAADVDRDGCHELVVERGELPPQVVRLPRPIR